MTEVLAGDAVMQLTKVSDSRLFPDLPHLSLPLFPCDNGKTAKNDHGGKKKSFGTNHDLNTMTSITALQVNQTNN